MADTPVTITPVGAINLGAADRFINVMRTPGSVLKFTHQADPVLDYPPLTDTIVIGSAILDGFPLDILNFRVGRFLVVVGPSPAANHPSLGNFLVYSTKFPGITVYLRKRAVK